MSSLIERQAAIDSLAEWHDDAITNRLNNLPSAQQWIPVTDRLPQESQNVLTIDRYGDYEINHIIEGDEWYWEPSPVVWMPLPEPYKEHADADHD